MNSVLGRNFSLVHAAPTGSVVSSVELLSFQNFSVDDNYIHLEICVSHWDLSLFNQLSF